MSVAVARRLVRRFDARIAAGVVTREGLSTLLRQYVQAFTAAKAHSNPKNRKRRAGGARDALSTVIAEHNQTLPGGGAHSNPKFALPKRNRGGQYGNENRRIHGVYSAESLTVVREGAALARAIEVCESVLGLRTGKRRA